MSYLGEYLVPPVRQTHNEGDPYLREFRAVKHVPAGHPTGSAVPPGQKPPRAHGFAVSKTVPSFGQYIEGGHAVHACCSEIPAVTFPIVPGGQ